MSFVSNLLTIKDVAKKVGLSKSTLQRMIAANRFPLPAKLSERKVVWLESEVEKWLKNLPKAERNHYGRENQEVIKPERDSDNKTGAVGNTSGSDIAV